MSSEVHQREENARLRGAKAVVLETYSRKSRESRNMRHHTSGLSMRPKYKIENSVGSSLTINLVRFVLASVSRDARFYRVKLAGSSWLLLLM